MTPWLLLRLTSEGRVGEAGGDGCAPSRKKTGLAREDLRRCLGLAQRSIEFQAVANEAVELTDELESERGRESVEKRRWACGESCGDDGPS